jgi:type II secretion system protein G
MYANAEVRQGNIFPRTFYDSAKPPTEYTGVDAKVWSANDSGIAINDVTASLYLALRTQDINSNCFVCPSSSAIPWTYGGKPKTKDDQSNFPSREVLSYSYACPFGGKAAAGEGWRFNASSLGADNPLVSDMNPGGDALLKTPYTAKPAELKKVNSLNHQGEGQNVAYADGHVEWQKTPYCGAPLNDGKGNVLPMKDNLYTFGHPTNDKGGEGVKGLPNTHGDTVMLPTVADGKQPPAKAAPVTQPVPRAAAPPGPANPASPKGVFAGAASQRVDLVTAKTDLASIELALDQFEVDNARYPTAKEGLQALVERPAGLPSWRGPYLKTLRADPWGHPYRYQSPGKQNPRGCDVYTAGPDGIEGNADDIGNFGNWTTGEPYPKPATAPSTPATPRPPAGRG